MAENGSVEKVRFEDREWMLNEPFIRQLSCLCSHGSIYKRKKQKAQE